MRSKLRVAIVTESFLPQVNGVTNSVLRILESFSREGHQAMVIAPESADAPHEYAGFRVKRVPSISVKGLLPVGMPQKTIKPLIDGFQPEFFFSVLFEPGLACSFASFDLISDKSITVYLFNLKLLLFYNIINVLYEAKLRPKNWTLDDFV